MTTRPTPPDLFESNIGLAMHVLRKFAPALRGLGIDIDDARQQALLGLWHAARQYRAGAFASYAVPCIRGYVLMAQRNRLRESLLATDDAIEAMARSREEAPTVAAEREERAAAVRSALAALTPGDDDVMGALLMHEECQVAVASRLGVSRTRVQQRWNRALPRLRAALAAHGAWLCSA